ncbi:MAG: Acetyltransferase, partial [Blastococcus sp.]|nr:Acetyltransferase [Blastococcus sp.]
MDLVTARRPTVQRIDDPDEEGPDVRPAEQRDVPRIAATLTVALADSRWTRWALPDDGRMQRLTRLHELDAAHRGVSTKTAWVTDDVDAVAVWEPPPGAEGTTPLPADVRAALANELPYLSADRISAVRDTAALVSAARPAGPHWWLHHLGVRPSARRRGLAAAVLAPALL